MLGQITEERVRNEIKRLIGSVTEREPEEIPDQALLTQDLGVDSLMAMELMVSMDRKFDIDIPEEEFTQAKSVDDAVEMVLRYLPNPEALQAAS